MLYSKSTVQILGDQWKPYLIPRLALESFPSDLINLRATWEI